MSSQEWSPEVGHRVTLDKYGNKEGSVIGVGLGEICVQLDSSELVIIGRKECKPIASREEMTEEAMRDIDAEKGDIADIEGTVYRMIAAGYRRAVL